MSLGFVEIVRNTIINDVSSSRTAQSLVNETTIDGLALFSASSQVPEYLYTPIWELLGLSSSGELAENVVCNLGERKIPTGPCIIIEPAKQTPSYSAPFTTLRSDENGAKYADFLIRVQNVKSAYDIELVEQASLRLEWLLDFDARQDRGDYPNLTVLPGYGIVPNTISGSIGGIFRTRYKESFVPTASEWTHQYCVEFTRIMI